MFDGIRNWLASEQSLIIAVVSLAIAIVPLFQKNGTVSIQVKRFAAVCACLCVLIVANYIDITYLQNTILIPDDKEEPNNHFPTEDIGNIISSNEEPSDESTEHVGSSNEEPLDGSTENDIYSNGNVSDGEISQADLSISINNDFDIFYNGFHYEYPNPENSDMNIIIDFDKGISGSFTYSRKLTEEECINWMHGGRLYDEGGNEIGSEGNYPSFWSSPDGKFAIEFPKNIENGRYKYELIQFINDRYVSDSIYFDVMLPGDTNEKSKANEVTQDIDSTVKLDIYIDNWEYFNDGFYYENPDPDDSWFISYTKGISGNFHYSRELTEEEKKNWTHGGKLYDENGNEVGSEGNYPSFWSSPSGRFAIEFPKEIPKGKYTYNLYQYINNTQVSASIQFDIN